MTRTCSSAVKDGCYSRRDAWNISAGLSASLLVAFDVSSRCVVLLRVKICLIFFAFEKNNLNTIKPNEMCEILKYSTITNTATVDTISILLLLLRVVLLLRERGHGFGRSNNSETT